ncbi:5-oxoprolinase subunit PxpB [Ancylobacter oerskovii]|uniref:5-oxoprolinase subunit PxpB n=1 Tax=Ancylobacter oerskovii TaxID=459519 RepID=A0ABW4Z3R7_9HYPH|nr:5-oxoprolinase subunit PxpB [Ancylobacter oerskovii]MBS7545880.1 5-oxoprolinase subunit PxpB [Ancylobacter oerskovii]
MVATFSPDGNRLDRLARFLCVGDTAFAIEFGTGIDPVLNARVHRAAALIREAAMAGVVETVPSFRSLLVHYDPLATSAAALREAMGEIDLGEAVVSAPERVWVIPALYGGEAGPDLEEVASATGLSPEEVVSRHAGTLFRVYVQGFLPGFAYLGVLPPELELPRLATPRVRVPPGSVAIAQRMSGIYPVESPGGWRLIGNTPLRLFDAGWTPPTLFAPGDGVRFRPVDAGEHAAIRAAVARGDYAPEQEAGR